MKPKTTEGMPARSSMAGFTTRIMAGGPNSERKIAPAMPRGAPRTRPPKVTQSEETIIGKMP